MATARQKEKQKENKFGNWREEQTKDEDRIKENNEGKGKNPVTECCRCGQPGQLAKDCRAATYNLSDTTYEQRHDNTAQWYDHVLPKQWLRCQLVL